MDYKLLTSQNNYLDMAIIQFNKDESDLINNLIEYIPNINNYNQNDLYLIASSLLIISRTTNKRTDEILEDLKII